MDLIKDIHNKLNEGRGKLLSPRLENEAIGWMYEMIESGEAVDPEDAAHATLDDIAGFESSEGREEQVNRLVSLYHKKFGAM